jgi:carboxypeptidase Q
MINLIKDTPDHKFYFRYHHSAGDSMTMMNADDLDSNVLGIACMFYILADLNVSLPLPDIKMDKVDEFINNMKNGKEM